MLTYNLEERGKANLYEYLYTCIKRDIESGKLQPGEKLPSKRALARNLGVSVITVENAYAQLLLEGYLLSEEKRGYFVTPQTGERSQSSQRKPFVTKYTDHEYFADLCANKTPYEFFPYATWAKLMREVLTARDASLLKTVPFNGIEGLRISIAEYLYQMRGMNISPDCIIIGAGVEYLYGRLIRLLGRDQIYAVEDPGYSIIDRAYRSYGLNWRHVSVDAQGIQIPLLEESGASVVHVSPSNQFPMGAAMSLQRRKELLQWCSGGKNRYIVEDDFDCEFRVGGRPLPTLFSLDRQDRVIYMNTFSKTLTPSIRISYIVLPESLMERYVQTLSFYSCTVSSFEQRTLEKFINGGYLERHINRLVHYYQNLRKTFLREIQASSLKDRVVIHTMQAGTQFLMRIKTHLSDNELAARIAQKNIRVAFLTQHCEGEVCMVPHIMVVNYSSLHEERIPEVVRRLAQAIEEAEESQPSHGTSGAMDLSLNLTSSEKRDSNGRTPA